MTKCSQIEVFKMLPSLEIESWKEKTLEDLTTEILCIAPKPLILIDGKAGSGKTSLAEKIKDCLDANMVSTDDICWHTDPIDWDGEMLDGIVLPWLDGKNVSYRPSGWVKKDRAGTVNVDSNRGLIIEGNGACRESLRKYASYSIWVDTDPDIARERVIQRDLAKGENGGTLESVTEFTDWWDSLLDPFLLKEKAWAYSNIIVSGIQSDFESGRLLTHVFNRR